jgi:hypothetical protein
MLVDPFAVVASIQNLVAKRFQDAALRHEKGQLVSDGFAVLRDQLTGADRLPRGLQWNPLLQPELLDLPSAGASGSPLSRLAGIVAGLDERLKALLGARTPHDFAAAVGALFQGQFHELDQTVLPFVRSQVGILLSLATTTTNLPGAGSDIEHAILEYFFTSDGFRTVDGLQLVAPVHIADLNSPDAVKSALSKSTAEKYVRDLIQVIVEAADDFRYNNLRSRHDSVRNALPSAIQPKFDGWFKGFPAMAESATMQAVEEATLGISEFQTNSIIAASAGSFAGTAAKKAAQHVFLRELESF